ncbi:MAG: CPBP family intramembrane metalloprotease, partial [Tindallia sp. MSAO_Bac2]
MVQLAPAVVVIASGVFFGPITTPDAAALSQGQLLFISWGSLVIVAAIVILLACLIDKRPIAELGMTLPTKPVSTVFLGIGIGAIAPVLMFIILWSVGGYKITGVNPEISFLSLNVFFLVIVPAALNEEIVFRGYTIANLKEGLGLVPLITVSAIIFTLFHTTPILTTMSPVAFISYFLGGLLLAIAFVYNLNLWLPTWIHIRNNYIYSLLFTPSVGVFEGTMVVGKATRDIIDAACVLTAVIMM